MISAEDAHLHQPNDDPYWNESGWFSFSAPERALHGFIYCYHRPNMGATVGGVAIWDPSGEQTHTCRYYSLDRFPMPAGADMFDFALPNGLTVRCLEPARRYAFSVQAYDCRLELEWTAFMDPHDSGFPSGADDFGKGHWEQGGRIRGTIELEGETMSIDSWSAHDHSWGPRHLVGFPSGDMGWAIASPQSAFLQISVADPHSKPGAGSERIITGWYIRDGTIAKLVSGTRTVERDDRGRPVRIVIDGTDALGRELHAEGVATTVLDWHWYTNFYMFWSQLRVTFDGHVALGETQDYWPLDRVRRFVRGRRAIDAP
jgi:hypothetical protein